MINVRMSFLILLTAFVFVFVPSFAVISSSQSNDSLSNNSLSNNSLSNVSALDESNDDTPFFENETSFSSLSRSLAETNQSEEPTPPPPPSDSESGDETDGGEGNN